MIKTIVELWEEFMKGYRRGKLRRLLREYGNAVSRK